MQGHEASAKRDAQDKLAQRRAAAKHPTNGERELQQNILPIMHTLPRIVLTTYADQNGATQNFQNPDGSFPYLIGYDGPVTP